MPLPPGKENRRSARIAHSFVVRYWPTKGEAQSKVTQLEDFSKTGARFLSEHAFIAGDRFDVQLVLPTASHPVEVKARVAWAKPWRVGLFEVGVTFDPGDVGIQQTIDEAVKRLLANQKPIR